MFKKSVFGLMFAGALLSAQAAAEIIFYEGEGFRGRTYSTERRVGNLERAGFNNRASSVIVERGYWEVCDSARFQGHCVVLRPGSYDTLRRMGMNNRISSVRPAEGRARHTSYGPEPLSTPTYEYRRRPHERLYDAPVTSVRAVMGPPERRCWVERQQVVTPGSGGANVGGAIAGAVIGGILGHQIGSGSGRDIATAGGAAAGAVIGANVGREGDRVVARDVRRCETAVSGPPQYWDVSYTFRGVDHRVQMSAPPGRTIAVNARGEPRG
jgi:uncharacterized protein YcfJ